jgi:hypothetical protein
LVLSNVCLFDQQALDKVSNIPNDFLILDKNNDFVVTGLPNRIFTTTKAHKKKKKQKHLIKAKNRHILKRKNRIIKRDTDLHQHHEKQ